MKQYYVYILECSYGSYYTGITSDIERRLEEHHSGIDSKAYTYSRRPLKLRFCYEFFDPNQAIDFEKQIKGWSRKKKEAIINDNWEKLKELSKCRNESSSEIYRKRE